ncbi:MAG: hypothetical protein ACKO0Z_22365 [Betaproteobacteria bacterium]
MSQSRCADNRCGVKLECYRFLMPQNLPTSTFYGGDLPEFSTTNGCKEFIKVPASLTGKVGEQR